MARGEAVVYRLSRNEGVLNEFNCAQVVAWVALAGSGALSLSLDQLARAGSAVCRRHPLLRGRWDPARPFELAIDDSNSVTAPVTLRRLGSREEAWAEFERQVKDFVWKSSAMLQIDALQYPACAYSGGSSGQAAGSVALIVHANHAAVDGRALQTIIRDLVCALGGVQLEPLPMPAPYEQRFPELADANVPQAEWERLSAQAAAQVRKAVGLPACCAQFHTFSEEQTSAIVSATKARGVTVTALLLAAGALAAQRDGIDLGVIASVRQPPAADEVSCSISRVILQGVRLPGPPGTRQALWRAAQTLDAEIKRRLADREQYRTRLAVDIYHGLAAPAPETLAAGVYPAEGPAFMGLSSMGVADGNLRLPRDVGDRWAVQELVPCCGNLVVPMAPTFFALTLRGRLAVTCTSTHVAPGCFSEFFQRAVSMLSDAPRGDACAVKP
eukprot:m51a1_g7645 hypothetical protein (443) ;mRNA; r:372856-374324